jgi:uncharacterized protein YcsI (UPF0317 family)
MEVFKLNPSEFRQLIRSGQFSQPTSGYCDEYVQANMVIVPKEYAFDFFLYAYRNPKSCPIIDILEAGEYESQLAKTSDIRTDLPLYHIFINGQLIDKRESIKENLLKRFGRKIL